MRAKNNPSSSSQEDDEQVDWEAEYEYERLWWEDTMPLPDED